MEVKSLVVIDFGSGLETEWEGDPIDDQEYIETILAMFPWNSLMEWYRLSGYQGNVHVSLKELDYEDAKDFPTGDSEFQLDEG